MGHRVMCPTLERFLLMIQPWSSAGLNLLFATNCNFRVTSLSLVQTRQAVRESQPTQVLSCSLCLLNASTSHSLVRDCSTGQVIVKLAVALYPDHPIIKVLTSQPKLTLTMNPNLTKAIIRRCPCSAGVFSAQRFRDLLHRGLKTSDELRATYMEQLRGLCFHVEGEPSTHAGPLCHPISSTIVMEGVQRHLECIDKFGVDYLILGAQMECWEVCHLHVIATLVLNG